MRQGQRLHVNASRLVWQHFHGDIPAGMCINHKNGVKDDNRPSNLELVTYSENLRHAYATRLKHQGGETTPGAKLLDVEVKEIRQLYASRRYRLKDLAARFGVTMQTVSKIVRGERRTEQGGPISRENPRGKPGRDPRTGQFVGAP